MKVVLLGATGATGCLLARQLVAKKNHVTAIVRNTETEALSGLSADHLKQVRGTVLGMSDESLEQLVQGCDAVLICLGHTISFSGIFGKPRLLVTDTLKKIVKAVDAANKSENKIVKLVLMNSVGVRNKGLEEKHSVGEGILLGLLYFLIPPHKDNVLAADYLTDSIQKDTSCIEWVSVRPVTLIDESSEHTDYKLDPLRQQGVFFSSEQTGRFQVAHFMSALIDDENLWKQWKGKTPVLSDASPEGSDT